jgi:hypothetical protein
MILRLSATNHYGYTPCPIRSNISPHLPIIVVISTLLASRGTITLTVVARESVADSILGLLEHALALVTSLLRVRLHAIGLHRSHGAVHAARCLVLGLLRVRLHAVGLHGLGGFVGEGFASGKKKTWLGRVTYRRALSSDIRLVRHDCRLLIG